MFKLFCCVVLLGIGFVAGVKYVDSFERQIVPPAPSASAAPSAHHK